MKNLLNVRSIKRMSLFYATFVVVLLVMPATLWAQEKTAADYLELAEQGDAEAQVQLGRCYYIGKGGVEENGTEAFKWFLKAAEQNNGQAFYYLGQCYKFGSGVEKNLNEAISMYKRAVELEYNYAAYTLGQLYDDGEYVPQDMEEAFKWYKKAAELGSTLAKEKLQNFVVEPEEILKDFTFTKQIIGIVLDGNFYSVSKDNVNKATLECIDMGTDGRTLILDLDIPELKQRGLTSTYSWSGGKVRLLKRVANGNQEYLVIRGQTPCGGLFQNEDGWIAMVNSGQNCQTISGLTKGMSRLNVEQLCSELGFSKFKAAGTVGGLRVYTLQWLDMQKRYNFYGTDYHYEMNNNKEYAKFYFNTQDKLVKWIIY